MYKQYLNPRNEEEGRPLDQYKPTRSQVRKASKETPSKLQQILDAKHTYINSKKLASNSFTKSFNRKQLNDALSKNGYIKGHRV